MDSPGPHPDDGRPSANSRRDGTGADPQPPWAELEARAAALLRAGAPGEAEWLRAEWSQAGAQHSARVHAGTRGPDGAATSTRIPAPDGLSELLAALRHASVDPHRGAWLSVQFDLDLRTPKHPDSDPASDPHTTDDGRWFRVAYNHDARPWWNSPAMGMTEQAPAGAPVPSDEDWHADFAARPRSGEHVPEWLRESLGFPGAASARLRGRLDAADYPRAAIALPLSEPGAQPVEGALTVAQTGPHRFVVGARDYGVVEPFSEHPTEHQACEALWRFLLQRVPAPTPVHVGDLNHRSTAYQHGYASLFQHVRASGPGGALTTLPPGLALDRVGAMDGVYLFPWGTPLPARSLPPHASGPDSRLFQFVSAAPLHVQAEIVEPWFGQPGGALRFRIASGGVGVRQLVLAGSLIEVRAQH